MSLSRMSDEAQQTNLLDATPQFGQGSSRIMNGGPDLRDGTITTNTGGQSVWTLQREARWVEMANQLVAMLVYEEAEPVRAVETILLDQGMRTRHVHNCAETRAALREPAAPALVFTDTILADGTWADILKAARTAPEGTAVIVVSRVIDIPLYLDVLESGAYDFIVPPFAPADLAYIVGGAVLKARSATSARPSEAGRKSPVR